MKCRKSGRWICLLWVFGMVFVRCELVAASDAHREQPFPPQPLTIEAAVDYGLKHNPVLQATDKEVQRAEEGVKAARAGFLPKLDASYDYSRLKDPPIAKIQGLPGLSSGSFQTNDTKINRWQVNVSQPLFTGLGVLAQYRIAGRERDITDHRRVQTRLDLVQTIQQTFIQILLTEKVLRVAEENIERLEVHRNNAEAYFQQGLTPQNDVLKAEVALADVRQREKTVAKQAQIQRAQLNRFLGLEENAQLSLTEWSLVPPPSEKDQPTPSLNELYALAEKQRPVLLANTAAIRQAEEGMRLARSNYYPHVFLVGTYYREGKDFLASENDFLNDHNAAVGVRVDWNWFEGGKTRAGENQSRYQRQALEKRHEDLLRSVRVQVEDAYEELQVARSNLATARVALKQAEENLRITNAQYREQTVIFSEVLDAEVFLTQAQTNYYQAQYGYQMAWVDLERAVGGRLGNHEKGR